MGIVGGGFGAHFFWHLHPDCEVTAVSDLREDRRKTLAEKYKCNKVYAEFHPMLQDPNVDAVAMFTPAPTHVEYCVDVLNAGKHVVCAVPAAFTLEGCQKLVDAVKKTGLTYMQAETSCYHGPTLSARKMRLDGKFGTIYFSQGEYLHDVREIENLMHEPDGKPSWRYGYPPAKYPTHATGPVIFVTGERMTEVTCVSWGPEKELFPGNQYKNHFVDATFLAKTSGGHSSRIAIHHYFGGNGDIAERAEYWGTDMVFLEPRFGTGALLSHSGGELQPWPVDDHTRQLPPSLREHAKGGHAGSEAFITDEFVSAVLDGRRPLTDGCEGVAYCAPGICAYESARKNSDWVKVPDFGWHS
jgi:predicted dehydrogenase